MGRTQLQLIAGAYHTGYGHEFEKAFLSYDLNLQENSGHFRIIRYSLGGIDCLVRFEVDGYLDNSSGVDDELDETFSGLNIQNSVNMFASSPDSEVKVIKRGRLVDNKAIVELKSCSAKLRMQKVIPQLWISQTHHLRVGWHEKGLVTVEPETSNMDKHFPAWEVKNQEHLHGLVDLITRIRDIAKGTEGGKCMLVCEKDEKPRVLRVYERDGKDFSLPVGVREKCWRADEKK